MLKQQILSADAIFNIIDFLIEKDFKNIFVNFCYVDDDELPSITVGGTGGCVNEGDFDQILLNPNISKRESLEYYPFINACFNLAKKFSISCKLGKDFYSIAYENISSMNPYLDYKKIKTKDLQILSPNEDYILIRFNSLETINLTNEFVLKDIRKPHVPFFNLMNIVKNNTAIKYYKLIKEDLNFYISTKNTSNLLLSPLQNLLEANSPFQEDDPQCQELEMREKSFANLNVKVKPFLISHESNSEQEHNKTNHGIYFIHNNKIIYFDDWTLTTIKKRKIFAKDPNKLIRIRVLLEGDVSFNDNFSINPITRKLKISNSLIKIIDERIEVALSQSIQIIKNIDEENEIELSRIAKSDALAAFKELVYKKKINKEEAIKIICENGEMLKFDFIEDYLREKEL